MAGANAVRPVAFATPAKFPAAVLHSSNRLRGNKAVLLGVSDCCYSASSLSSQRGYGTLRISATYLTLICGGLQPCPPLFSLTQVPRSFVSSRRASHRQAVCALCFRYVDIPRTSPRSGFVGRPRARSLLLRSIGRQEY